MRIAVIGGGAAGFFAAIQVKENFPHAKVFIVEKTTKVLSKVRISGGGRCNVTNACADNSLLLTAYPRGTKLLKYAFNQFNTKDTQQWFANHGVALKTEEDGRIFPVSNSSQTIIDCFETLAQKLGIELHYRCEVTAIQANEIGLTLTINALHYEQVDKVIVTTGGSPKLSGLQWLSALGHEIIEPIPSLFTFNMPDESVRELMGVVVSDAQVSIQSTKFSSRGPLLITHWGMSGPAILKLSAFAARYLHEADYRFVTQVNWLGASNFEESRAMLQDIMLQHGKKKLVANNRPNSIPERLWLFLLDKADIDPSLTCEALGKTRINKLTTLLTNDQYTVSGKTTFKEEFVTCGGISVDSVHRHSLMSKYVNGLYFAGEVLDIDGITGGYNFQAAWSTAFVAGQLVER